MRISPASARRVRLALASTATFVGSVNYSGSFHVSAAHNADRAKSTQAKLASPSLLATSRRREERQVPLWTSRLYLENPLYNSEKMSAATAHANRHLYVRHRDNKHQYHQRCPCDKKLTSSLASGAVAAAESLVAETAARGQAAAQMIAATADADALVACREYESCGHWKAEEGGGTEDL